MWSGIPLLDGVEAVGAAVWAVRGWLLLVLAVVAAGGVGVRAWWLRRAREAALGPGRETRLGFDEVQAVLLAGWETAAELLPGLVSDPAGLSWAAPPTTELRMTCEQPASNGVLPSLDTLLDLAPLGTNDEGTRSLLAVTITATPAMERTERRSLLREALVHMAHEFGCVDADADLL
nr:hypothetical protein OG499_00205 [Streptomyces anulatus]